MLGVALSGLYIGLGIVAFIINIIIAAVVSGKIGDMAEEKGYDRESAKSSVFWTWIFGLGIVAAVYYAGLPDLKARELINEVYVSKSGVAPAGNVSEAEARTYNKLNEEYGIVKFGSYPQGPNGEAMPIKWRVLAEKNGVARLVSVDALDAMPFDVENGTNIWRDSSMRSFLNNQFFNFAFNPSEKEAVLMQDNFTNDSVGNITKTSEKVYLLSVQDVKNPAYSFDATDTKSISRWAKSSDYAKNHGIYVSDNNENCFWWLRNPGTKSDERCIVTASGAIKCDFNAANKNNANGGVRPAITVMTSALH